VVEQEYIEEILALGHEIRSFEAKGPGSINDKAYVAKGARAAMAMGNLRDGGQVCLGIDDTQFVAMLPGLTPEQVNEWINYNNVSDQLAKYSDPPPTFRIQGFTLRSGAEVVVLDIEEFDTDIHLCKKDFPGELQSGQLYVRPRGKPRSAQVPTLAEMRELANLAVDKGVREFVRRAGVAGIPLTGAPAPEDIDAASFENETDRGWADPSPVDNPMSGTIINGIDLPAYSDVMLRPGPYKDDRLRPDELAGFITEHAVRLRGWPVPMVDNRSPIARHGNWIGQDLQAEIVPHVEAWRLFTSGQFLHRRVVTTDLRDTPELRAQAPGATGAIAVWDVLLYLVEVAELGARFATSLDVGTMSIDVSLENLSGRELIAGEWGRILHGPYISSESRFAARADVAVPTLLGAPRAVGVGLTQQILRQFGLNLSDTLLDQWQAQILHPATR
jgi:hypothetical protein